MCYGQGKVDADKLKVYDGETHQMLFSHTKFMRRELEKEQRVIRVNDPIHFNAGEAVSGSSS